jgi:hypothetical protein
MSYSYHLQERREAKPRVKHGATIKEHQETDIHQRKPDSPHPPTLLPNPQTNPTLIITHTDF